MLKKLLKNWFHTMGNKSKTVLIVAYYWPPAGGSGVQRWLYFANELKQLGWHVIVVTQKNAAYPLQDPCLVEKISDGIEVYKIRGWEPYSLAQLGSSRGEQDSLSKTGVWQSFKRWVRAELFFPDARMFWIRPVVRFVHKYTAHHKVDAVVTSGPPHSAHMIGYQLKQSLQLPWLADFRDPWSDFFQNKLLPMSKRIQEKHMQWENKILKKADVVSVTSPSLKKKFSSKNPNCKLFTNGYESILYGEPSQKFSLVYTGVMKSIQNPKNLWKVLGELVLENNDFAADLSLQLIGYLEAPIINSIQSCGLQSYCEYYSYMSKDALVPYVTSAQLLLMVSVNDEHSYQVIPGKLFEYLATRRLILAIGNPLGDMANILSSTQAGQVFDYTEQTRLKKHILEAYLNFKEGLMPEITSNIDSYKRSEIANKLSDCLTEMIH